MAKYRNMLTFWILGAMAIAGTIILRMHLHLQIWELCLWPSFGYLYIALLYTLPRHCSGLAKLFKNQDGKRHPIATFLLSCYVLPCWVCPPLAEALPLYHDGGPFGSVRSASAVLMSILFTRIRPEHRRPTEHDPVRRHGSLWDWRSKGFGRTLLPHQRDATPGLGR